jgi:hypothetical protein
LGDSRLFLLEPIVLAIKGEEIAVVFFLHVFGQLVIGGPIKAGREGPVFYFAIQDIPISYEKRLRR